MKIIGIILGLILISSVFTANAFAFSVWNNAIGYSTLSALLGEKNVNSSLYCGSAIQSIDGAARNLNLIIPKGSSTDKMWSYAVDAAQSPDTMYNHAETYLQLKNYLANVCHKSVPDTAKLNPAAQKAVDLALEKSIELGVPLDKDSTVKTDTKKVDTKKITVKKSTKLSDEQKMKALSLSDKENMKITKGKPQLKIKQN